MQLNGKREWKQPIRGIRIKQNLRAHKMAVWLKFQPEGCLFTARLLHTMAHVEVCDHLER